MSTQQKSSGGGRKNKSSGAGQKDGGVAVEQNNNNSQISSKKHNNVNAKDAANNNTAADQSKTEKEKPHVKVSYTYSYRWMGEKREVTVNESNYIFGFLFISFLPTQPTAEQIRIAQITEIKSGTQDPTREKVSQLMELTERSEEDACLALYECDNDLGLAVI